jgi:hypothetical protein
MDGCGRDVPAAPSVRPIAPASRRQPGAGCCCGMFSPSRSCASLHSARSRVRRRCRPSFEIHPWGGTCRGHGWGRATPISLGHESHRLCEPGSGPGHERDTGGRVVRSPVRGAPASWRPGHVRARARVDEDPNRRLPPTANGGSRRIRPDHAIAPSSRARRARRPSIPRVQRSST